MNAPKRIFLFVLRLAVTISLAGTTALAVAAPVAALVCNKTWGGGNGDWTDAAHWTPNSVPLSTESACLPTGFYTVTVDATTVAQAAYLNVAVNAKLVIKGASATTLTIGGGAANAGTIEIGNGTSNTFHPQATLSVGGTLVNSGTIQALGNGDNLDVSLDNLAAGTLTTANGSFNMGKLSASITNSGTITVGGQLGIGNGATFTMAGGTITNNFIFSMIGGTFTHTGGTATGNPLQLGGLTLNPNPSTGSATFRVVSTGNTLGSDVAAGDTLIVEGGSLSNDGVLNSTDDRTNNGTIRLSSIDNIRTGRLTFTSGKTLTNAGTLESIQGSGGGGPDREIQANLVNQGTFNVGYRLNFDQASATLTQSSGATNINANLDISGSAGTFTLNGGTVGGTSNLSGNLNNVSGTVAPGNSPGVFSVTGDYSQGSTGTLAIQLGGSNAGTDADRFDVSGNASLDGTLALTRLNSFSPTETFSYDYLTYGTHSGTFSSVTGIDAGGGRQWVPTLSASVGHLTVSAGANQQRPDGQIKLGTGAFAGNNIYNNDGNGQSKIKTTKPGNVIKFSILISNDGTGNPDSFLVHATGVNVPGYAVKFKKGSKNITTKVVNGTFQTASLAHGAGVTITCIVTMSSGAFHGSAVERLVTISSVTDPTVVDAVDLVVHRN